jgi:hypothetical protein
MSKVESIYDYHVICENNSGWEFPCADKPLIVQLSRDYSIDTDLGSEMHNWLIEHKVNVGRYSIDMRMFYLLDFDTKFEFILRWS